MITSCQDNKECYINCQLNPHNFSSAHVTYFIQTKSATYVCVGVRAEELIPHLYHLELGTTCHLGSILTAWTQPCVQHQGESDQGLQAGCWG